LAVRPHLFAQPTQPDSQNSSLENFEAALESHKKTEEEVQARLRDLEKVQERLFKLEEERQKLLDQIKTSSHPAPPQNASLDWILGGACIFTIALCAILLLRMQKPKAVDNAWAESAPIEEPLSPATDSISSAPAAEIETESHQAPPSGLALPDWDSASPALDSQRLKTLLPEKNSRNRDSTIELAEIMLSFGRINSAAEALTNFIEKNPKEAFAPWLKLLEVYRANGQRTEFDKIALKLNKTFNVWMVNWNNFNDALAPAHSLETMTHIVERLQKLWGTRECQAYLQYLLRDTRDETRRGLPLVAVDDILCLSDILEHYLGPYTGPTSTFDSLDTDPMTEIERDPAPVWESRAKQDVGKSQTNEDIHEEIRL